MNALTVGWFVILALINNVSCTQPFFTTEVSPVTGTEGSCAEIECKVTRSIDINGAYWFWIKNSSWIDGKKLVGTVIFSTNVAARPVSSDFADRVKYIGSPPSSWENDIENSPKSCNILICNLSKTDNGDYAFRYEGKTAQTKWITKPSVILTVEENPCPLTFEKPPILNESEIITLTCSTSSSCPFNPEIEGLTQLTPTPTSKPQQIEEKQKSTTVSFPVDWQDDGKTFSCKAVDDKYLIQNISITVEYGPRETQAKKSLNTVVENQSVTLTCSAKGRPDPTFIWFKNEQKEMTAGAVLEIQSIKESQSGEYHCEAQNTYGKEKSNPVNITVEYVPEVEVIPAPSVVKEGDKMNLTCNVKRSNPHPTSYSWFLNGTIINQMKTDHYVVERIKPEDRGLYTCQAANTAGTGVKSKPGHIDVQYGPRKTNISMGKEDKRVRVGESLTFTCITDANPAAETYSWYRFNTNKQTDSLQWKSKTTNNSTLRLGSVQRADEAYYMCNATNRIRTGKNSEQVYIEVLYPPTIPNLSMDTEVKEGQLITITCTVESFPLSKLTLIRTSSSNPQRPEVFVTQLDHSHPNTLNHTFNVTSAHTGSYVCEARSSEGSNRSETRKLVVKYHPKHVTVQATPDFVVDENGTLTLQCSAHSHPQVTSITWMKMVNGKSEVIRKTRSFDLKSVSPSDRGWYSCAASNEIGTGNSRQAEVKVKYPPKHTKITRAAEQQNNDGTSSVTLSCSSDSYPKIKQYFWYKINKNKKDEKVSERQNFTVYSDQPGSYYCIAKNEVYERSSGPVHMFDRRLLKAVLIFIVLLILLIFVIVFFYRHRRRKSIQQRAKNTPPCFGLLGFGNGAKRRNRMNHPGTAGPFRSRDDLLPDQPRCQPPPDSTPASNISTVYCTVNLPPGKQGPSAPKPVRQQGGQTQDDSLNYASLHFGNEQKNKQTKVAEDVYAMVSKHKPPKKIKEKLEDYENITAARTAKAPDPLAYDTDTSEDEVELNYSQVNFTAKPGHQRARRDSSSSDEDETQYSEVKL